MEIAPFKDRVLDRSKPVEMYRCLNRKGFIFSLRQNGKVVGHTSEVVLKDCDLIINEAGKNRCITTKERNVHAFVRGFVCNVAYVRYSSKGSWILRYNPFEDKGFYTSYHGSIQKCSFVFVEGGQIYCQL